jgi:hypothetical protein
MSSRATCSTSSREKSWTVMTLISLSRALTQRSRAASSATTVAVMREKAGSWVGPTLRVSTGEHAGDAGQDAELVFDEGGERVLLLRGRHGDWRV